MNVVLLPLDKCSFIAKYPDCGRTRLLLHVMDGMAKLLLDFPTGNDLTRKYVKRDFYSFPVRDMSHYFDLKYVLYLYSVHLYVFKQNVSVRQLQNKS